MTITDVTYSGVTQAVAEAVIETYHENPTGDLPRMVLEKARAGDPRLHGYFEWDGTVAGEAYRLVQAGQIVRRVKVSVIPAPDKPPVLVRALIARCDLPSEEENQPGSYIATMELVGQTAYEASVIDSIRRDLLRLQRKYENTALLFALAEEVFAGKE